MIPARDPSSTRSGAGPTDAALVVSARAGEEWAKEALFAGTRGWRAIYGNTMYFTDGFAATVLMCTESGCPTTIPIFAGNTSNPFSIAVDAKGAYWLDDAGIEYCALPACASPTLLATSTNYPANLAINGSFVYWVEQDNSGTAGQVLRVPR